MTELDALRARAEALHLHGLVAHWPEVATQTWVAPLLDWEERQRACRSLERRLQTAHIGRFKPLCDFDWNWPKRCDRAAIEALMALDFLKEAANIVIRVGSECRSARQAFETIRNGWVKVRS